jgi:hypothetical protein
MLLKNSRKRKMCSGFVNMELIGYLSKDSLGKDGERADES